MDFFKKLAGRKPGAAAAAAAATAPGPPSKGLPPPATPSSLPTGEEASELRKLLAGDSPGAAGPAAVASATTGPVKEEKEDEDGNEEEEEEEEKEEVKPDVELSPGESPKEVATPPNGDIKRVVFDFVATDAQKEKGLTPESLSFVTNFVAYDAPVLAMNIALLRVFTALLANRVGSGIDFLETQPGFAQVLGNPYGLTGGGSKSKDIIRDAPTVVNALTRGMIPKLTSPHFVFTINDWEARIRGKIDVLDDDTHDNRANHVQEMLKITNRDALFAVYGVIWLIESQKRHSLGIAGEEYIKAGWEDQFDDAITTLGSLRDEAKRREKWVLDKAKTDPTLLRFSELSVRGKFAGAVKVLNTCIKALLILKFIAVDIKNTIAISLKTRLALTERSIFILDTLTQMLPTIEVVGTVLLNGERIDESTVGAFTKDLVRFPDYEVVSDEVNSFEKWRHNWFVKISHGDYSLELLHSFEPLFTQLKALKSDDDAPKLEGSATIEDVKNALGQVVNTYIRLVDDALIIIALGHFARDPELGNGVIQGKTLQDHQEALGGPPATRMAKFEAPVYIETLVSTFPKLCNEDITKRFDSVLNGKEVDVATRYRRAKEFLAALDGLDGPHYVNKLHVVASYLMSEVRNLIIKPLLRYTDDLEKTEDIRALLPASFADRETAFFLLEIFARVSSKDWREFAPFAINLIRTELHLHWALSDLENDIREYSAGLFAPEIDAEMSALEQAGKELQSGLQAFKSIQYLVNEIVSEPVVPVDVALTGTVRLPAYDREYEPLEDRLYVPLVQALGRIKEMYGSQFMRDRQDERMETIQTLSDFLAAIENALAFDRRITTTFDQPVHIDGAGAIVGDTGGKKGGGKKERKRRIVVEESDDESSSSSSSDSDSEPRGDSSESSVAPDDESVASKGESESESESEDDDLEGLLHELKPLQQQQQQERIFKDALLEYHNSTIENLFGGTATNAKDLETGSGAEEGDVDDKTRPHKDLDGGFNLGDPARYNFRDEPQIAYLRFVEEYRTNMKLLLDRLPLGSAEHKYWEKMIASGALRPSADIPVPAGLDTYDPFTINLEISKQEERMYPPIPALEKLEKEGSSPDQSKTGFRPEDFGFDTNTIIFRDTSAATRKHGSSSHWHHQHRSQGSAVPTGSFATPELTGFGTPMTSLASDLSFTNARLWNKHAAASPNLHHGAKTEMTERHKLNTDPVTTSIDPSNPDSLAEVTMFAPMDANPLTWLKKKLTGKKEKKENAKEATKKAESAKAHPSDSSTTPTPKPAGKTGRGLISRFKSAVKAFKATAASPGAAGADGKKGVVSGRTGKLTHDPALDHFFHPSIGGPSSSLVDSPSDNFADTSMSGAARNNFSSAFGGSSGGGRSLASTNASGAATGKKLAPKTPAPPSSDVNQDEAQLKNFARQQREKLNQKQKKLREEEGEFDEDEQEELARRFAEWSTTSDAATSTMGTNDPRNYTQAPPNLDDIEIFPGTSFPVERVVAIFEIDVYKRADRVPTGLEKIITPDGRWFELTPDGYSGYFSNATEPRLLDQLVSGQVADSNRQICPVFTTLQITNGTTLPFTISVKGFPSVMVIPPKGNSDWTPSALKVDGFYKYMGQREQAKQYIQTIKEQLESGRINLENGKMMSRKRSGNTAATSSSSGSASPIVTYNSIEHPELFELLNSNKDSKGLSVPFQIFKAEDPEEEASHDAYYHSSSNRGKTRGNRGEDDEPTFFFVYQKHSGAIIQLAKERVVRILDNKFFHFNDLAVRVAPSAGGTRGKLTSKALVAPNSSSDESKLMIVATFYYPNTKARNAQSYTSGGGGGGNARATGRGQQRGGGNRKAASSDDDDEESSSSDEKPAARQPPRKSGRGRNNESDDDF